MSLVWIGMFICDHMRSVYYNTLYKSSGEVGVNLASSLHCQQGTPQMLRSTSFWAQPVALGMLRTDQRSWSVRTTRGARNTYCCLITLMLSSIQNIRTMQVEDTEIRVWRWCGIQHMTSTLRVATDADAMTPDLLPVLDFTDRPGVLGWPVLRIGLLVRLVWGLGWWPCLLHLFASTGCPSGRWARKPSLWAACRPDHFKLTDFIVRATLW